MAKYHWRDRLDRVGAMSIEELTEFFLAAAQPDQPAPEPASPREERRKKIAARWEAFERRQNAIAVAEMSAMGGADKEDEEQEEAEAEAAEGGGNGNGLLRQCMASKCTNLLSPGSTNRFCDECRSRRNHRKTGKVRRVTISLRELIQQRAESPPPDQMPDGVVRPRIRRDCLTQVQADEIALRYKGAPDQLGDGCNAERPCPFVACKYHLYLGVTESGGLQLHFPDLAVEEMEESCALDIADHGDVAGWGDNNALEDIGIILGITRERVRQIGERGLFRLKNRLARREEEEKKRSARYQPAPPVAANDDDDDPAY